MLRVVEPTRLPGEEKVGGRLDTRDSLLVREDIDAVDHEVDISEQKPPKTNQVDEKNRKIRESSKSVTSQNYRGKGKEEGTLL